MILNPKWNSKIKSRFQTIVRSIQIPFSKEIQISYPILWEIYFFLQ
jgi:hypothetical protein